MGGKRLLQDLPAVICSNGFIPNSAWRPQTDCVKAEWHNPKVKGYQNHDSAQKVTCVSNLEIAVQIPWAQQVPKQFQRQGHRFKGNDHRVLKHDNVHIALWGNVHANVGQCTSITFDTTAPKRIQGQSHGFKVEFRRVLTTCQDRPSLYG